MKSCIRLAAPLLCALLGTALPSLATEEQEIVAGFNSKDLDVPEAKYDEYRDVPKGMVIDRYRLGQDGEGYLLSVTGTRLRQNDQHLSLDYERPGGLDFSAWWNKTPHRLSHVSRTPFGTAGVGIFTLNDEVQRSIQATGAGGSPAADASLLGELATGTHAAPLTLLRDDYNVQLGFGVPALPDATAHLRVRHERKTGDKALGAPLGFNLVVELPEPVDYSVTEVELASSLRRSGLFADFQYAYSNFENSYTQMVWDSPRRFTDATSATAYTGGTGSSKGRLQLPPDNQEHRASIGVGGAFPYRTNLSGWFGWSRATQTEALQPYTINTAIIAGSGSGATLSPVDAFDPASLPASELDGRIVNWNQSIMISSRPVSQAGVMLRYRHNHLDNQTGQITFPGQVRLDQTWEVGDITNHLYGRKRTNLDAEVTVDPHPMVTVTGAFGRETVERDDREVHETVEDVLRGSVMLRPMPRMKVRAEVLTASREMEDFDIERYETDTGALFELPGLRRSDVADRDRDRVSGRVDLPPLGDVKLSVSGYQQKDDYKPGKGDLTGGQAGFVDLMFGLLESERQGITAAADISLPRDATISLLYDYAKSEFTERSNLSGGVLTQEADSTWSATNEDKMHTVGVEAEIYPVEAWRFGATYMRSQGKGKIRVSDIPGTPLVESDPDDTESLMQEFGVEGEYMMNGSVSFIVRYDLTDYNVDDWAAENIPVVAGKTSAGAFNPNAIYLSDFLQDFRAHLGSFRVKYRW